MSSKVPPHSDIAEKSIIKGILEKGGDAVKEVIEVLPDGDAFYSHVHKELYSVFVKMFEQNKPIDLVTIVSAVKSKTVKQNYILEIVADVSIPTSNVRDYALIVKEKQIARQLIQTASKIVDDAYSEEVDKLKLVDDAEDELHKVAEGRIIQSHKTPKNLAVELYADIEKRMSGEEKGIKTFLYEYDLMISDMRAGDYIILAGRTSMGKTSLALSMAYNIWFRGEVPVGFITCEMTDTKILMKLTSMGAKVPYNMLRSGKMTNEYLNKVMVFLGNYSKSELHICKEPSPTVAATRATVKKLIDRHEIKVLFFDYLQLIRGSGKKETREREIAEFSAALRGMALEYNLVVVALAQLNRQVEIRKDRVPQLSDLRESGSIENDADIVSLIYRPSEYGKKQIDLGGGRIIDSENKAVIINAKGRETGLGDCILGFEPKYSTFYNLELGMEEPPYMGAKKKTYSDDEVPF